MKRNLFLTLILCFQIYECMCKEPIIIQPKNLNDRLTLAEYEERRALVIGGGLAGLSAALELVDRGYKVTVKEIDDVVGGKLATRPKNILNQTFYVEHGFHAWFNQYYQFQDIRNRLNVNANFKPWATVDYVFKDYLPEKIYSEGIYPFNLFGVVWRSPNLSLLDSILSSFSMPDLFFYDFNTAYEKYDHLTFDEWAKLKYVNKKFYEIVLQPALSITLNERGIFSAAEMLMMQQFYFLSTPEADKREVTNINYYDALLRPWSEYLESKGAKILLNTGVVSLKIDSKTQLVYGSVDTTGDDETVYDHVIMAADIGPVQSIFKKTYENFKYEPIKYCMDNYINKMKISPDYKVIRVWFDKQLNSSAPEVLETPDFYPVNLIAQYHILEEEFAQWAQKTGGSVIEFHLYTFSQFLPKDATDDQVWTLITPTVRKIYPEIFERNFKVLAYNVNSYQNFASFEKNLFKFRPNVNTPSEKCQLKNLYLSGDWVKVNYPAALMERAVTTGREAANEALLRDGVRQAPLKIANPTGPGLGFFLIDIIVESLFNYYHIIITVFIAYKIKKYFY